ncbi:MlaD family protein [Conexibacter sp. SYSU D00693]|uniref:MlaD family protein n=1 Tax=Conexibacter sp. SYSU D00693 TaxID=2812560 RepID=UPI00196B6F3B|nr:MlaD family protein [Conexibacter sp. SYSU D00693]
MRHRPASRSALFAAIAFAISVFVFTLFVWRSFGGSVPFGAQGYRVQVQFGPEASNLFPNAEARIAGVRVGKVKSVVTREGAVDAEVELEARYAPLPADAKAIVRSKTLLGESYLELTPGTKGGRMIPEGGRLSSANVEEAQGLDRVLSAFDRRTRRDLAQFLEGLGDTLEDRGPGVGAALGRAPLAMEDLRKLVDALDRQRGAVQGLVRDVGTTLRAVGDRAADARAIATQGRALLRETARRDRSLTATVRELPATLVELRRFSGDVESATPDATAALRTLRPVAPDLAPALRRARTLAPQLGGALVALGRTMRLARAGLPALSRVVDAAKPVMGVLDPAGQELVPLIRTLDAYREDAVAALANSGAISQASYPQADGTRTHILRGILNVSGDSLYGVAKADGAHRDNPYLRPGGMADMLDGRLRAFDCSHARNPSLPLLSPGGPPCLQQEPFSIAGSKPARFPHVERDP